MNQGFWTEMLSLVWLVPALPFASFVVLALFGRLMPRRQVAVLGAGSIGLSAAISVLAAFSLVLLPTPLFREVLWQWMDAGNVSARFALFLDPLSVVFVCIVTVVGFFIHLYSVEFMAKEEGYSRFFAYMNLFVASMTILVLADNLVLLLLGWEGVGLCSYLLIGFWYSNPENGKAARKAFIVTRIGDTAMEIGLFLLFWRLGTLDIQQLILRAGGTLPREGTVVTAACLLLLGGAIGKSGQIPLQVWLPDAMAGPTPVSALLHAATMVTAGVYLIARLNGLYLMAPDVMLLIAVIGAATLFVAACSALVTRDLKRILAYSTISQIGYMFLALGTGAWAAAIFHFVTHAFFKSVLFLSGGVVIDSMHDEHDIFRMGGLRRSHPVTFVTFLAGAASLSALPLVTAGYFSKDLIIEKVWSSHAPGPLLILAMVGSFLTALYSFRLVFTVFLGPEKHDVKEHLRRPETIALIVLAIGSIAVGFLGMPGIAGGGRSLLTFLSRAFPAFPVAVTPEFWRELLLAVIPLPGILVAWWFYVARPKGAEDLLSRSRVISAVHGFLLSGWKFDRLYDAILVRPFIFFANLNRGDFVDSLYDCAAIASVRAHDVLAVTQSGLLRTYAAFIVAGGVLLLAIMVFI